MPKACAAALRLTYPEQQGAFPGRNSLERINIEGLADEVSRLVGEPLRPIDPLESHAKCRITLAADTGRAKVHIDHSHWSGILYLSRPEDSRGGTDCFRHIPTDSDRAPMYEEGLGPMGFGSYDEMHRATIETDSLDDWKWERNMSASTGCSCSGPGSGSRPAPASATGSRMAASST